MKIITSAATEEVIHFIVRKDDFVKMNSFRADLVSPENFLQLSMLKLEENQQFAAHIHKARERKLSNLKAQEAWVVLAGKVEVQYYDLDRKLISVEILNSGDCSVTLHGGHGYKSLDNNTLVLEFKTGPYEGRDIDKEFI